MGKGAIDYKGQEFSENLYQAIVLTASAIAFAYGWYHESFLHVFYGWAAGSAIACVLCIPDWGIFNRNPVKWLSHVPPPPKSDKHKNSSGEIGMYVTMAMAGLGVIAIGMLYAARSGALGRKYQF
jgi:signal peptidase complex subunit 1